MLVLALALSAVLCYVLVLAPALSLSLSLSLVLAQAMLLGESDQSVLDFCLSALASLSFGSRAKIHSVVQAG